MNLQIVDEVQNSKFADHSCVGWGYTYFVGRGDLIKIGHSAVPRDRMTALQCGFPEPLEILAIIPNAIIDEPTAHKRFAHLRMSGEWFRAAPELMEFIAEIRAEAARPSKPIYPPMRATEMAAEIDRCLRHLTQLRPKQPLTVRPFINNLIERLKNLPRNPNEMRPLIRQSIEQIEAEIASTKR